MKEARLAITRMEMYSGSFVLFVGIFFLATSLGPLFQNRDAVPFNAASFTFWKMLFYALLNIGGAVLLFMRRKPGWAICTGSMFATVLFPLIIMFGSLPIVISREQLLPLLFILLATLALIFMFNARVRKNQRVNNADYLLTFIGYGIFFCAYYLL